MRMIAPPPIDKTPPPSMRDVAYTAIGEQPQFSFLYKNHEGKIETRTVELPMLWFGTTPWYPAKQWMIRAYDLNKKSMRDFAVKNIISFGEMS